MTESGISERVQDLYRRAAAAVAAVEQMHGAGDENARLAEADFFRSLMEGEELAERDLPPAPRRHLERGLVQVYTGNGKGKTTAAVGLAARAAGSGLRVCIVQFMKGAKPSGEIDAVMRLPAIKVIRGEIQYDAGISQAESPELQAESRALFEKARLLAMGGEYDLIVLDEINIALFYKFVSVAEALELARTKPEKLELVFTGRYALEELLEAADLVTEMKEIKHPGNARRGIEY